MIALVGDDRSVKGGDDRISRVDVRHAVLIVVNVKWLRWRLTKR